MLIDTDFHHSWRSTEDLLQFMPEPYKTEVARYGLRNLLSGIRYEEGGTALIPIKQRLRTYDVRVDDDGDTCPNDADVPGGVETFAVKVEAGSVWVNL